MKVENERVRIKNSEQLKECEWLQEEWSESRRVKFLKKIERSNVQSLDKRPTKQSVNNWRELNSGCESGWESD